MKALALGMSQATKSTLRSIRPLMKWTLRESRSSFAMTSLALCFRHAARAFSSSGRSERLPDSTSVNSPISCQLPPVQVVVHRLALCGDAIAVHALMVGRNAVICDEFAVHDPPPRDRLTTV